MYTQNIILKCKDFSTDGLHRESGMPSTRQLHILKSLFLFTLHFMINFDFMRKKRVCRNDRYMTVREARIALKFTVILSSLIKRERTINL